MPKVWNKRDPNCPKDAVYVGRPSKWGNLFTHVPSKVPGSIKVSNRAYAIAAYSSWLQDEPEQAELLKAVKKELRGKDLVCWCAPLECHADILLKIANEDV